MVHADHLSDPEILAYRSPGRYGSRRLEQGSKAKIKRVQVGSFEEVASLSHFMPFFVDQNEGFIV